MSDVHYSEKGFWESAGRVARAVGRKVLEPALMLYYAAQRDETPPWAKAVVYSALGYLILPIDAIPDALPVVGYADDAGVLTAAVATIAAYIDQGVRERAETKLSRWLGRKGE